MARTKQEVREMLGLDEDPSDELMQLLAETGDESRPARGPRPAVARATFADLTAGLDEGRTERAEARMAKKVGELFAMAREEAGLSLQGAGNAIGVSKARTQQLEQSTNTQISTLHRYAAALGYDLIIGLQPTVAGRKPLQMAFPAAEAPKAAIA